MTDKRIQSILHAGKALMNDIDPEGVVSSGSVTRIKHNLTEDNKGFLWKAYLEFPSGDRMTISGHYHDAFGNVISKCTVVTGGEKSDLPITPSKNIATAINDFSGIPVQFKRNLSRISLKSPSGEKMGETYDMSCLRNAIDALFWEVEGGDVDDKERSMFRNYLLVMHHKHDSVYKTDIIGNHPLRNGYVFVRTSVDIYGLSDKQVLVEKRINECDEVTSYCYTDDNAGRKQPSLKLAFLIDDMLSRPDCMQKRKRNKKGLPSSSKR